VRGVLTAIGPGRDVRAEAFGDGFAMRTPLESFAATGSTATCIDGSGRTREPVRAWHGVSRRILRTGVVPEGGHRVAVTLRDVAREAGVSTATASRALAGRDGVSPAVRKAVENASRRLDYRPSAAAASLRTRSTGALGMVIPDITNPFFPAMVQGVEHEFARRGLSLVLCDSEERTDVEASRIDILLRQRVDALIVCPVDRELSRPAIERAMRHFRVIQVDTRALDEADFVGVDALGVMDQLVDHLRQAGARTAVFVGSRTPMSSVEERLEGFTTACGRHGMVSLPPVPAEEADLSTGHAAVRQLVSGVGLPDAIVCANDLIAFGVLGELREVGARCPEDVLVTGFDDLGPAAELLGLTTIRQPLADIGREAARLLQFESSAPRTVRLAPNLVVRASTSRTG
jgi:LacI family transcriptional regulator